MTDAEKDMVLVVLVFIMGTACLTSGTVLLGVPWVVWPVMTVCWGFFFSPLARMTHALNQVYLLADACDEGDAVVTPEALAAEIEGVMGLEIVGRVRRRRWAEDRRTRAQEAARE